MSRDASKPTISPPSRATVTVTANTLADATNAAGDHLQAFFRDVPWRILSSDATALMTMGGRALGWEVTFEATATSTDVLPPPRDSGKRGR